MRPRQFWLTLYWENGQTRAYFLTQGDATIIERFADRFPRSHRNNGAGLAGYAGWQTLGEAIADGQAWQAGVR